MKVLTSLRARWTPPDPETDMQAQREKILLYLLALMSILGLLLLANYIYLSLMGQRWIALGVFSVIYLWTLTVTIFRRLPYKVRSFSLLAIIYILGFTALLQDGLAGNGRVYLIALPILAGVLAGVKPAVWSILLSGGTVGFVYALSVSNGSIPGVEAYGINFLFLSFLAFVSVSLITTVSAATLLNGLENSLTKVKEMAGQLQKERSELADHVAERTLDLERRLVQIRTAAEVTRSINALLDPDVLLPKVVALIQERFQLYYVGVFMVDPAGEYAVLRAGTGEAGQKMAAAGHRLAVGGPSMIGWATSQKKARIALDTGQEAVHFNNPYLPLTRSELALPLVAGDQLLGALTIQSVQAAAFDQDDITLLQGIADSLATALENARLYQQAQENLEEIRTLHKQYLVKAWSEVELPEGSLSWTYENDNLPSGSGGDRLSLPLILRGQVIGKIELEGDRSQLSHEELVYTEFVSQEAAVALENVRLLRETQRRAERERLVAEVAGKVRSSMQVDSVLQTTIHEVGRILRASSGYFQLEVHPEGDLSQTPGDPGSGNGREQVEENEVFMPESGDENDPQEDRA
jgi:GAF domain-containing protein